ncbi:type VI secretion system protein ImpG [Enterobacter cloacae]|uniref:Type VI secretion system protein ImpG n=1 Tax=Enterobacter cloacae TaxID=550 RepID=A0A377LXT2_ENTCL|nr:type VI secretion system protein ImpG [Enterobacter cloacae]
MIVESKLLEYYNRELAYLREMGAEFAERYPKVADGWACAASKWRIRTPND